MVSTQDFESCDPSSNLGRTLTFRNSQYYNKQSYQFYIVTTCISNPPRHIMYVNINYSTYLQTYCELTHTYNLTRC